MPEIYSEIMEIDVDIHRNDLISLESLGKKFYERYAREVLKIDPENQEVDNNVFRVMNRWLERGVQNPKDRETEKFEADFFWDIELKMT